MHFAALVVLVVVASTVPSLAAPAPIPHPQVAAKRYNTIVRYNTLETSRPLPSGVVKDTASDTKRQAVSINEYTEDTSSNNAKRQATDGFIGINYYGVTEDTSSDNAKRQVTQVTNGDVGIDYGVTEDTSSNNTKFHA